MRRGGGGKPHKYRAKPTVVDGIRFDSKREAARWGELQMLQKAGHISDLRHHVVFPLHVPMSTTWERVGEAGLATVSTYEADFVYLDHVENRRIVEDVKGMITPVYRLKRKHMLLEHGIEIREIR